MCSIRNTRLPGLILSYTPVYAVFVEVHVALFSPFMQGEAFEPSDIRAMSTALDDICRQLRLPDGDHPARRVVAERIIDLARCGERNPMCLRDRVLKEAGLGGRWLGSVD